MLLCGDRPGTGGEYNATVAIACNEYNVCVAFVTDGMRNRGRDAVRMERMEVKRQ
ncbi:hypothetical protein GCM10009764_84010 [Nocardia ninae]|uniref:Uncharacterized protein n=1 Tax=Nocardia ninae NBRC 108245 TaxID=1210091 RepID=A0A511M940_9NOCA|nr:hypothetical protein NN4_16930 [Nocardia ninae NBRC 108245]